MNPQGIVPTLDDDGFILWESRAIMTYLVNEYAPESDLYPADPQNRAIVDRILYFDADTLFTTVSASTYIPLFHGRRPDQDDLQKLKDSMYLLNIFLKNSTYVAGNHLTLADLSVLASVSCLEVFGYNMKRHTHIHAWLQKLKELPYYEELCKKPLLHFKTTLEAIQRSLSRRNTQ